MNHKLRLLINKASVELHNDLMHDSIKMISNGKYVIIKGKKYKLTAEFADSLRIEAIKTYNSLLGDNGGNT